MRGVISALAPDGTYGQIAADDGQRYSYWTSEVRNGPGARPRRGQFPDRRRPAGRHFHHAQAGPRGSAPAACRHAACGAGRRAHGEPGCLYAATPAGYGAPQNYAVGGEAIPTDQNYWIALLTSPSGRISRKQFWLHGVLPIIGIGIVLRVVAYAGLFIMPTFVLFLDLADLARAAVASLLHRLQALPRRRLPGLVQPGLLRRHGGRRQCSSSSAVFLYNFAHLLATVAGGNPLEHRLTDRARRN